MRLQRFRLFDQLKFKCTSIGSGSSGLSSRHQDVGSISDSESELYRMQHAMNMVLPQTTVASTRWTHTLTQKKKPNKAYDKYIMTNVICSGKNILLEFPKYK